EYAPAGGTIEVLAEKGQREAIFRVRDTGIGISADALPKIFDVYYQGETNSGEAPTGLGLGLPLVRQLAEIHGGSVSASSGGIGKGAEFLVRLPLAEAPKPDSPRPAAVVDSTERTSPVTPRKILVVDDNSDSADATALLLEADGHQVRAAYDGPSAIEAARALKPELALVDIGLPGMDGYQVAARLKELIPGIRLAAFSGWRIDPGDSRARDAGFDALFVKPLDVDRLTRYIAGEEH